MAHEYFRNLFDDVLDNDNDALNLFQFIIKEYGISRIDDLTTRIEYPRKNEICKVGLNICLNWIQDISNNLSKEPPPTPPKKTKWILVSAIIFMVLGVGFKKLKCS